MSHLREARRAYQPLVLSSASPEGGLAVDFAAPAGRAP